MGRMFEADGDNIQYGKGFVRFFKSFNDKAELIANAYQGKLKGLNIFDAMAFNIPDRTPVFDGQYDIPQKLKIELIAAFRAHRAPLDI